MFPPGGLTLEVKPGTGIGRHGPATATATGPVALAIYLEAYARLNGLASRLKAGEYALVPGLTPRSLLDRIVAGRVIQYPLTIVEGWNFRQLRQALVAHPKLVQTLPGP